MSALSAIHNLFLPISVLAYTLNAGSITIDKILIKHSLPKPIVYTFYVNVLQLAALLLLPWAKNFGAPREMVMAVFSGIAAALALQAMYTSLQKNEASVVGPIVGMLNPFFALIIGSFLFHQLLTPDQYTGFFVLLSGSAILTANIWFSKLRFDDRFNWMILSGLLFAVSYVLLAEAYKGMDFISGLVAARVSSGLFVLTFLLWPSLRQNIFASRKKDREVSTKTSAILLFSGQTMGAVQGLLISFAISLANPALVNSLFGVQYIVIITVALALAKKRPGLLDETLTKNVIALKTAGALIISLGLFLLTK